MWFKVYCALGYMLTTRLSKPYAHQALRLRLCAHHAIVKAICSPRDELWLCGSRRTAHPAMCSPGDCQSHMLTRRCASGYVFFTRLSKPYAHRALHLWLYAHHAMSSGHVVQGVLSLWLCVLHAIVKAICSPGVAPPAICSPRDELWSCGSRRIEPLAICSPRDELWPYGLRRIAHPAMCSPRDCQSHMLTRRCASDYMLTRRLLKPYAHQAKNSDHVFNPR